MGCPTWWQLIEPVFEEEEKRLKKINIDFNEEIDLKEIVSRQSRNLLRKQFGLNNRYYQFFVNH